MSPEQARGRPVDRRADIWAFGVVLYEMLAGRRTFDGEDVSITMAGVLKSDPDWTALPADLPSGLRKLLRRCLEKDPRQRLQSIGDARLELSDIAAGQSEASGAATLPQVAAAPRSGRALPWTLALAGFAGLVVVALMHFREPPAVAAAELRTEIVTPSTLDPTAFALSPDGKQMAFVASVDGQTRLWLRALNASAAQPLPGTDGAAFPFWSPDSRSIGFFADGKLKRLTIGSAAQAVTGPNFAVVARGGSWNGEGVILFARNTRSAIFRVPASGGEPVAVSTIEAGTGHRFPYFLPDGRHFLFSVLGSSAVNGIYLGTLDGSESTRLVTVGGGDTGAVYLPPGWMLWVHSGTLVAQRLDVEKRTMIGDPVTIAEQVAYDAGTQAGALSVSATGLISYRLGGASHRQLRWFDRAGKALGPLGAPDEGLFAPRVSPDGRRAAVYRNFQNTLDIWLMDETRLSRLTFDAVQHRFPIWSPDGSQVAFDAVRKQARDLYVGSPARPGGESLLLESSEDKFASDWSADGRFLLYTSASPQTNADMWVLPLIGERKPWPFLQTPAGEKLGQFSPDGRWIAYMSNDSGMNEVYVRPFVPSPSANASGAGERWQISSGGGMHPKWRADGKELFFVGPEGQMMGAPIAASGSAIEPGKPVVLFQTRIYGGGIDNGQGSQFDVARDGRFLINTVLDESASAITLLQNWKAR
jgi:Tol biopolymer transport system component